MRSLINLYLGGRCSIEPNNILMNFTIEADILKFSPKYIASV